MKRFIKKILIYSIMVLVTIGACVTYTYREDKYNRPAYIKKCELMEQTPGPRLVFVGGSNLAYGLDSKRISDSLHINVVNFGVSALFGLEYILDDASTYLRSGDIIVIMPEEKHFYGTAHGDPLGILTSAIFSYPNKSSMLNVHQWKFFFIGLTGMATTAIHAIYSTSKEKDFEYRFNEYGDEVGHWETRSRVTVPKIDKGESSFDSIYAQSFVKKVNELSDKNQVIILPPILAKTLFDVKKENFDKIAEFLSEHNRPFQAPLQAHVVSDTCLFENNLYHVTKPGVDYVTGKIIEELRPLIKKPKEVSF